VAKSLNFLDMKHKPSTSPKMTNKRQRPDEKPVSVHPRYSDLISNVKNFKIIESTLREGEQFANAFFDQETKIRIAKALDEFGVEYIELTSPAASEQSRLDCIAICNLGLKAKVLSIIKLDFNSCTLPYG
jgi:homocitrate synthase